MSIIDDVNDVEHSPGTAAFRAPMPAGSSENQLMLNYRVETNMAGGEVQFTLPSGWAITTKVEAVTGVDTGTSIHVAVTLVMTS